MSKGMTYKWRNRPDTITGNAKAIVKNYIALKMIKLEEKGEPVSKPSEIKPVGIFTEPLKGLIHNTYPHRTPRKTGSSSYIRAGVPRGKREYAKVQKEADNKYSKYG